MLRILVGEGFVIAFLEVTVISAAEGMFDEKLRTGEEVLRGLVEHKAERADIDPMARASAGVEELYVAVLVKPELQSLRGIVHLGRHHGEGKLDLLGKLLIDIEQRGSFREALRHIIVLAADL